MHLSILSLGLVQPAICGGLCASISPEQRVLGRPRIPWSHDLLAMETMMYVAPIKMAYVLQWSHDCSAMDIAGNEGLPRDTCPARSDRPDPTT